MKKIIFTIKGLFKINSFILLKEKNGLLLKISIIINLIAQDFFSSIIIKIHWQIL